MKGYLLDTNVALIGLAAPERLPSHMLEALDGEPLYLSVLSYWEVLLKSMKGRLEVGEPRAWWLDALDKLGATPLPLRPVRGGEKRSHFGRFQTEPVNRPADLLARMR